MWPQAPSAKYFSDQSNGMAGWTAARRHRGHEGTRPLRALDPGGIRRHRTEHGTGMRSRLRTGPDGAGLPFCGGHQHWHRITAQAEGRVPTAHREWRPDRLLRADGAQCRVRCRCPADAWLARWRRLRILNGSKRFITNALRRSIHLDGCTEGPGAGGISASSCLPGCRVSCSANPTRRWDSAAPRPAT